jgi:fatty acid/phospholipid biosynthesis enzyme
MPLTNAGRDAIASRLINDATTVEFDNANAKIGVGDSTTAFAVAQTDLQAAANKFRKAMDATFPTIAGNAITFRSTYIGTEANWAWNEWAVFNAAAAGTMLQRMVEYNGTKLAGQTWVLQVTITVNIGV